MELPIYTASPASRTRDVVTSASGGAIAGRYVAGVVTRKQSDCVEYEIGDWLDKQSCGSWDRMRDGFDCFCETERGKGG